MEKLKKIGIYKIGQIFELFGERYMARLIECDYPCLHCSFHDSDNDECILKHKGYYPECIKGETMSVIFKKYRNEKK